MSRLILLVTSILFCFFANGQPPDRILFITHSAGFKHPVLPHATEVMKRLAPHYRMEVTASEDVGLINQENLKNYAALVFFTSGELPMEDSQREAFLDFIRSGKAFVGIHSATDTFYEWEEYGKLIGGYFDQHPWNESVTINVETPGHPAVAHLGSSFQIHDEIYQFRNYSRQQVNVLLSLDTASTDMTKPNIKRTDADFALAWTNTYASGRIFYTALGHRPEVWDDPRFQKHLFEGIAWAMGRHP